MVAAMGTWSTVQYPNRSCRRHMQLGSKEKTEMGIIKKAKPLPLSRIFEFFEYDPESGNLFWKKNPVGACRSFIGRKAGTVINTGYLIVKLDGEAFLAHRIAWTLHFGCEPKHEIDHINRVRSDNRIANLRDVPCYENNQNKGISSHNTSGIKGVYWHKNNRRWWSQIGYKNKLINLGSFDTKEEAALAYKAAKQKFHSL